MKVITNNRQRELVSWIELPKNVRGDFEYIVKPDGYDIAPAAWLDEAYDPRLVEYLGSWYDIHEFERIIRPEDITTPFFAGIRPEPESPLHQWDAAQADSYFSCTLMRWGKDWSGETDYESVVMGRAHW